jgi:type I restriction enzyme M protein
MSSQQSGEGDIRKAMVEADVVECMVALPPQLFSNTQIPACLWFMCASKRAGVGGKIDRRKQFLFIDARKTVSGRISRTQVEFTEADLHRISLTYHRWRDSEFSDGSTYEDAPGFCKSVALEVVREHAHVLTPGRYVGSEADQEEEGGFGERMDLLTSALSEQLAKSVELDRLIREKLGAIGYAI